MSSGDKEIWDLDYQRTHISVDEPVPKYNERSLGRDRVRMPDWGSGASGTGPRRLGSTVDQPLLLEDGVPSFYEVPPTVVDLGSQVG